MSSCVVAVLVPVSFMVMVVAAVVGACVFAAVLNASMVAVLMPMSFVLMVAAAVVGACVSAAFISACVVTVLVPVSVSVSSELVLIAVVGVKECLSFRPAVSSLLLESIQRRETNQNHQQARHHIRENGHPQLRVVR